MNGMVGTSYLSEMYASCGLIAYKKELQASISRHPI